MAKKVKKRIARQTPDTIVIPSAENAKWVAIGFLAAAVIVSLAMFLIIHAHIH